MISFYPGPSRVHDRIPKYVKDAHRSGIMSINHRSDTFVAMSEKTIGLLKQRLHIPATYTVFFTGSATESWEIIAQSVVVNASYHVYNGAFGQKWYDYTKRLQRGAVALPFGLEEKIDPKTLNVGDEGVICLTQNETSNGTQVDNAIIAYIKKHHPKHLVAVDATSSMAGIMLDFAAADIWFASVQKCFGMPAGLGLMICSPQAMEHAQQVGEKDHYNSITFMASMMDKWQTPFTPNVLAIYLLMRVLEDMDTIDAIDQKVTDRFGDWIRFLSKRKSIAHLVTREDVRSFTVLPIKAASEVVQQIKAEARKKDLLLGEGYGDWKTQTFRIANFPALKKKEIETLKDLLKKY